MASETMHLYCSLLVRLQPSKATARPQCLVLEVSSQGPTKEFFTVEAAFPPNAFHTILQTPADEATDSFMSVGLQLWFWHVDIHDGADHPFSIMDAPPGKARTA